jgi:predicted Rossmann fold nucleotide-binding protein DprA/Smf involved in DNA uptake
MPAGGCVAELDVLAVVGSQELTEQQEWEAVSIIIRVIEDRRPDKIVSGGAKGVDTLAKLVADRLGVPFKAYDPQARSWGAPGGFRDRNRQIVHACTRLLCLRSAQSRTYGSGWTADEAERQGKPVRRVSLERD